MRQTIKALLREMDPAFCECDDGSKALEVYRAARPDWVLMDARMPDVDGITATRLIKAAFPMARIIMISGYNDPFLMRQAQEAGAMAYVLKDDLSPLLTIIAGARGGLP